MQPTQLDAGLTEEQVRTLADWLTLGVFTQQPLTKDVVKNNGIANLAMPEQPAPLQQESTNQTLRVVFATVADNDGHYYTAPGMALGLAKAGEKALRQALEGFAGNVNHIGQGKSLQQIIKRIKVDVMGQLVPIDPERVHKALPIVSDRSLVGVILGQYDNAWLAEESLRHDLVKAGGQLNMPAIQKHLSQRLNKKLFETEAPINTDKVWIFGTVSRLVLLKLNANGQLTIENAPLLRNHHHAPELNESVALKVATEGAAYIARHTGPDGRMNYMYDAANDKNLKGYNILRHAGSLWSMLQVYHDRPTTDLFRASNAALTFLKNCIVPFSEQYPDTYVVAYDNEAKLGGNGLGLVGLAAAYKELGATDVLPLMQGLARWIVGTQAPSGEFIYHKVFLDSMTKAPFMSDYYPGEAILGLMQLYKIDRNYRWLEAADKAARWLINVRDSDKSIHDLNRDHWLLYGLNDLYRELPRPEFLTHTKRIIACIQAAQLNNQAVPDLNGGFQDPLNVTATGCMCEGMLAGYSLLRDMQQENAGGELEKLEASIEVGLQLQLNYRFDEYNSTYLRNPKRAQGGFQSTPRRWSMRIDFPQHSLTSFLMYWRASR